MIERFDDWANPAVGFGTSGDKHSGTTFRRRSRLHRQTLTAMYEQSPIVARVVDKIADDAFRPGPGGARPWSLTGLPRGVDTDALMRATDALAIDASLMKVIKWGNLYGGALGMLPVLDGGLRPDQPLDPQRVRAFFPLQVVTAHDAIPFEIDAGFGSPTYLQVLSYDVTGMHTLPVRVHHSRAVRYEPIPLPYEAMIASTTRWGPGVVERLFDDLAKDGAAPAHALSMMYVASVLYAKLDGYRAKALTKNGKHKVREILAEMRRQLDALGILGLDKGDEIGNLNLSIAGAHEIIDRMRARLASASPMPREILFNEAPTGLRGGELSGAQDLWYGTVGTFRRQTVTPMIRRILEIAFAAWGLPADLTWDIEWSPLWVPRPEDQAAAYKTTAEGDAIYMDRGVYSDGEVRRHRSQGLEGPVDVDEPDEVPSLAITAEDVAAAEAAEGGQRPQPQPQPAEGPKVADEAMNGAQWAQVVAIGEKVTAGLVTRDQGAAMIRAGAPSLPVDLVGAIVGPPQLAAPAPPSLPGAPPASGVEPQADAAPEVEPAPSDLVPPRRAADIWSIPTRQITLAIERGPDSVDGSGRPNGLRHWRIGSHKRVSLADVARLASGTTAPQGAPQSGGTEDAG